MTDDDMSEAVRQAKEYTAWQQEEYQLRAREQEQEHNADLASFAAFIDDLDNDQLDYIEKLISNVGGTANAYLYKGILVGCRLFRRGLMVDGRTYEEALGLDTGPNRDEGEAKIKTVPQLVDEVMSGGIAPLTADTELEKVQDEIDQSIAMGNYNLERTSDSDEGVQCRKCKMPYGTLKDAIETINRKGGCSNCIMKEKWG
ncbi:hypothetical protein SEA_AMORE2_63 [Gordonia phage Amore2]|nr:hypothetical protein SEA_AMORE2_63 [Gordonia phage Amore2]